MPVTRFALIIDGSLIELRRYAIQPSDIPHKLVRWLPCPEVTPPSYDPALELLLPPAYVVQATQVLEQWTKRNLTAPELDTAKQSTVDGLNGVYKTILKAFLIVVNDIRDLRAKANAIIDATGISGTVPKYTQASQSQVTLDQLKTFIKNNL